MPDALWPVIGAAVGLLTAVVTVVWGPTVKGRIEARAKRDAHDQEGWGVAVDALKKQVATLTEDVDGLRSQVKTLTNQVREKDQLIVGLEDTVTQQSKQITVANARVRQLEDSWPAGHSIPVPDPGTRA